MGAHFIPGLEIITSHKERCRSLVVGRKNEIDRRTYRSTFIAPPFASCKPTYDGRNVTFVVTAQRGNVGKLTGPVEATSIVQ